MKVLTVVQCPFVIALVYVVGGIVVFVGVAVVVVIRYCCFPRSFVKPRNKILILFFCYVFLIAIKSVYKDNNITQ